MKKCSLFLRDLPYVRTILISALILVARRPGYCQGGAYNPYIPERFGVVDIIPNNLSGETAQNSEPSVAVGTGSLYGEFVVHAFAMPSTVNTYYTSVSSGTAWANIGQIDDRDCTMDWSGGGNVYAAFDANPTTLRVTRSVGIPGSFGSALTTYVAGDNFPPDQPWVKVVSPKSHPGQDFIYVAFNDVGHYGGIQSPEGTGKTASIRYSLNSGATWTNVVVEKQSAFLGTDMPSVRLALSVDARTNYALFVRPKSLSMWTDLGMDVVLTRDDNNAGTFTALPINGNGGNDGLHDTQIAKNIPMPETSATLGSQRLGNGVDVAIDPNNPQEVYVAYTTILPGTGIFGVRPVPIITIQHSVNRGVTFTPVYSTDYASSIPALAVLPDGTVGMLFAAMEGINLEVKFLKAPQGNFGAGSLVVKTLARWPDNNPVHIGSPYIGDYFQLKSVGYNFYGVFGASNDPKPKNFPTGVYYQRNIKIGSTTYANFSLTGTGMPVDLQNNPVNISIDPFFFYDLAAVSGRPKFFWTFKGSSDPSDPYGNVDHFIWPALPESYPQFKLESSPVLGNLAAWTAQTNGLIETNGVFEFAPDMTASQQYFRLNQDVASGQFRTFVSVDDNGTLTPSGILTNAGLTAQTFTATPANDDYAVGNWYLDGAVVQSGSPTLTLSNIISEHTLQVTFAPLNDVAVSVTGHAVDEGPGAVNEDFEYDIVVENTGLTPVTGVTMTNILDPTVSFVSADSSQGGVTNFGNLVTAYVGTLSNGASARIVIGITPNSETTITNTVTVGCDQIEPDLDNNTAIDISDIFTRAAIATGPTNQTVNAGDTATFTVDASGTPPFFYQWLLNGTSIPDATNAVLTITNVTAADAGNYEVGVFQEPPGLEDLMQVESDPATLTVNPGP